MKPSQKLKPNVIKLGLLHLFFLVISLGIKHYDLSGPDLIWNMFLAMLAMDFAFLATLVRQPIIRLLISLLWLFFYPNTFYMLTDIIHMHFAGKVLYDERSLILYMLYVPSILFGVLSGLESVRLMLKTYLISSPLYRLLFYVFLSFISSLAIHIGRYARLNSWDLLMRPAKVLDEMTALLSGDSFYFIAGFTCIQLMCLCFIDNFKTSDD
ncbi:DUF1361 domain-containing protein [Streptococcus loxodontisalivarius]|nr:DUF1361 domain-containing protein [Streptococcus loxodontisalivarius]